MLLTITGTIRKNLSWLLTIVIGFAMLGFLLMDATSGSGPVRGKGPTIGKINGKKVSQMDLANRINILAERYPGADGQQIEETAWNQLIQQAVFEPRFDDLGVAVSPEELAELLRGVNPHPYANQFFSQGFGEYDPLKVAEVMDNMDEYEGLREQISNLEGSIMEDQKATKYQNLLRHGINVPDWMARNEMVKQLKTVDIDFVRLPYTTIKDIDIKITEADIIDYAKKHTNKYIAKLSRGIQYISFPKVASEKDTTDKMTSLQNIKTKFEETQNDSLFALTHSRPLSRGGAMNPTLTYHTKELLNLDDELEESLFAAKTGDVVGPHVSGGQVYLFKVLEKRNVADSAKVRHILLRVDQNNPASITQQKTLADSLIAELKKNRGKFEEFVTTFSDDPGSKETGGEYGFFPQGQMVPEFNAASFYDGRIRDYQLVLTQFGYHIVEPLQRKGFSKAIKLATIMQNFTPSADTNEELYKKAKEFERNSQTAEDFENNATEFGGMRSAARIAPDANTVSDIGEAREIVRWAYDSRTDIGDVKYIKLRDQYVVARLSHKTAEGDLDIENKRPVLTNEVRKEKKSKLLFEQIETAKAADLQALAAALNTTVQKSSNAKFGGAGENINFEPNVISKLFFMNEGDVVGPLKGNQGVYVVKINKFNELPAEQNIENYRNSLTNPMLQNVNINAVINAMTQAGTVEDERYKIR